MEITYLSHASFKIRGKGATLVTDPFDEKATGLKFPKVEADVVTISHQHRDHNAKENVEGTPLIISGAGEYEVRGVKILGKTCFHDNTKGSERGSNTVYRIMMDGISLVHCGDLGHKFTDNELEAFGNVDVVMIPVGGFYTLDPSQASEVISQLDPHIIIPMHYNTDKLDQGNFGKLLPVSAFLKEMGKEGIIPVPKLTITKDKLPAEPTIVVFE